jgi:electron transport complex protein RnfC
MVQEVVLNGAECEPYITADTLTMTDRAEDIFEGIQLLEKYLGVKKVIIGIEDNKPQAIKAMQELSKKDSAIVVKPMPAAYPQGGEKVLIYNTTGKTVPEGKLPLDVGCIVMNVTTLACIAEYVRTGMPLVEKCLTVDGSAVATPKNVIAPIGTSMKDVFDFCGGFKEEPRKVMYGGPMMGIAVPTLDEPILKNTNAILAFNDKDATLPDETPCIRCGNCINHCPLNLNPPAIAKALASGDGAEIAKTKVNICMECGACVFVCPAHRMIVHRNKLAKAELRAYQTKLAEQKKKEEENK